MKYIETNELRIGNLVLINNKVIELDSRMFHAIIHGFEGYDPEPIPLTEEWLLRFGFHYTNDEWIVLFWVNGRVIFTIEHTGKIFIEAKTRVHIKYVHQLQNLYFALSGSELVLK